MFLAFVYHRLRDRQTTLEGRCSTHLSRDFPIHVVSDF